MSGNGISEERCHVTHHCGDLSQCSGNLTIRRPRHEVSTGIIGGGQITDRHVEPFRELVDFRLTFRVAGAGAFEPVGAVQRQLLNGISPGRISAVRLYLIGSQSLVCLSILTS